MESSSFATATWPLARVSVSLRGAVTGHSAKGATSTLHLASVCMPRVPCRMSAKLHSFSLITPPLRKRVHISVRLCPKVTDRSNGCAPSVIVVFEPLVHRIESLEEGQMAPSTKESECIVAKYWYLSCSAPRCGRERAPA
eukprot:scaffold184393_cov28-Tisochrysis_lutea.AAC.1